VIWGGIDYARQYCDRVVQTYQRDRADRNYQLTRAVVWNLAKVMLIKDEPYVAAMLTSPEKYKRDQRRWKVNPARGDRIVYRHHNRPEFEILGRKIQFRWRSRDWQLRLMAGATWLRKLMPRWHRREREFRDWYAGVVDSLSWSDGRSYDKWVRVLKAPEPVTGFREVRYPKMEAARAGADALLSGRDAGDGKGPGRPTIHISLSDQVVQAS
jgi:indolepyruvate ferredoxin oxidoreductase